MTSIPNDRCEIEYAIRAAHRKVGEHEVLPPDGETLQTAQKEGDIAILAQFYRHLFHALLGRLVSLTGVHTATANNDEVRAKEP